MTINKDCEISLDELLDNPAELSPATYQYYKGLKNNTIILNDIIDSNIVESTIIPLLAMDNDPDVKNIEIVLNSNGGDVYSGMALCAVIDRLNTDTTIKVISIAASMGGLIAMAGKDNPHVKKVCYPYSVFLLHSGSYFFDGSANQVKDSFKFQEQYEEKITDYILSHTTIPKETYEIKTRYEWYLDASQAKGYNIIDEIL